MAEETLISWADATLNFWVGCTKVSVGDGGACEHCYAETWAARWPQYRNTWGVGAPRVQFKHTLSKAKAIEARGRREGRRMFVFSNSLSDIFDKEVPIEWLVEALEVMAATPGNIYLLLSKRGSLIVKRLQLALSLAGMTQLPQNVALGITVVTQEEADRDVRHLLRAKLEFSPAFAFLSMEPLMGPVDLRWAALHPGPDHTRVDWVIVGGESGARARETPDGAFESVMAQCEAAGVPFHMKQMTKKRPIPPHLQRQERPIVHV